MVDGAVGPEDAEEWIPSAVVRTARLCGEEGPLTVDELADEGGMNRTTAHRQARSAMAAGLVERRPRPKPHTTGKNPHEYYVPEDDG